MAIENELRYVQTQLKIQEAIHGMVDKSLDKLKELGYPVEKIEAIRKEFEKPMQERKPTEIAPLPSKIREDLITEVANILQEAIPTEKDSVKAHAVAEKIVEQASLGIKEIEKISDSATLVAKEVAEITKEATPEN